MIPGMVVQGGAHHMRIDRYTGLDAVLLPLLPRSLRLRKVAKKILRHHGTKEIVRGEFTFSLPGEGQIYEIVGMSGEVKPFEKKT